MQFSGVEGGVDDEAFVCSSCARVYVATSNDGQGPSEDLLVELQGFGGGAGKEEVGVDSHW
jgi:hypothetical protein